MCGRYTMSNDYGDVVKRFQIGLWEPIDERLLAPFNIAPTQQIPIVVDTDGGRQMLMAKWGFRPLWMREDSKVAPINARAETVASLPMFRDAVKRSRCLIPADGFYEWKAIPGQKKKQPVYFRLRTKELFAFAGLWTPPDAERRVPPTAVIITTTPNELVAQVHNRMPVILTRPDEERWIDRGITTADDVVRSLRAFPAEEMEGRPVVAPGPLG